MTLPDFRPVMSANSPHAAAEDGCGCAGLQPWASQAARGRRRRLLSFLGACFAFLGRAVSVTCGAVESPLQLPPWEVVESRLAPNAAPIRATALLPAAAWSNRPIATLADAFRHVPGAVMQESFGGFEPPRLSIRGSGLQSAPSSRGVALLLDELPLGLADGSFNSALFDPLVGGQVQVQRGVDGWRETAAVLGGALDLRTPDPATAGSGLRLEAGANGAVRARAQAAAGGKHAATQVAAAWARQDGWRAHSAQERFTLSGTVRLPAAAGQITAGWYGADVKYEVPGPLTLAVASAAPAMVSADVRRDRPRREAAFGRFAVDFVHRDAGREVELGASLGRTMDEFIQLRANGATHSRSTDLAVRGAMAQRGVTGRPHQLRVAASAARGWREVSRLVNDSGTIGAEFARDSFRPDTAVISIEDQIGLTDALVASAGIARVFAARPTPGAVVPDLRATLPQASLTWRLRPAAAVFASVISGAEPPTYDDMIAVGGTYPAHARRVQPIGLQRAVTWEVGARGAVGALAWDLALYRAAWKNEILRLADADGAARGAVNASPTTHEGMESSLRWRLVDGPIGVSLAASAVWTRCTFDADPVYGGNRLAGIPPAVGDAEVLFELPRRIFAAVGVDWVAGRTAVDHAGRMHYDGRTLGHFRAGWRSERGLSVFFALRNVTDRPSIASTAGVLDLVRNPAATAIFLPAAGRTWTLGCEWKY